MGDGNGTTHTFYIVEFVDEKTKGGKKSIELVPCSWVDDVNGLCRYPGVDEYDRRDEMIQNESLPDEDWEKHNIKIIASAGSYKQGRRRLKRSFKSLSDIESTDSEVDARESCTLSQKNATNLLSRKFSLMEEIVEERNTEAPRSTLNQPDEPIRQEGGTDPEDNPPITVDPHLPSTSNGPQDVGQTKAEYKSALRTHLTSLREDSSGDSSKRFFIDVIETGMNLMTLQYRDDLAKLKRSLQYELGRRFEELNLTLTAQTLPVNKVGKSPREQLATKFPIQQLEQFLDFENSLNVNHENNLTNPEEALLKRQLLKDFMAILTASSTNYELDIKTILKAVIAKDVQILYSGAGRVVKGKGKKNFSATMTYSCMTDFIEGKYRDANTKLKILTITSDWLARAGDREGGCTQRKKEAAAEQATL